MAHGIDPPSLVTKVDFVEMGLFKGTIDRASLGESGSFSPLQYCEKIEEA